MRRYLGAVLCVAIVLVLVYGAYGQSKEDLDNLAQSKSYIKLLEKVEDAIETIMKERKPPKRVKELKFIDVSDFVVKVPHFAGPDVRVFDPEQERTAPGITFGEDEDIEDLEEGEPFGTEGLIELVKARTGDEKWPEEAGGFGTIEQHRGKLIVCNTPEVIKEVEQLLAEIRGNAAAIISSAIYLLSAQEEYLQQIRTKGSPIITPQAIKKVLADAQAGKEVKLIRAGYLSAYSGQSAYIYDGTAHTYVGDMDTSAGEGKSSILDPVVNIFREGLVVNLRAQYNRQTGKTNIVAAVNLCKLISIEEHVAIGGGNDEKLKSCKLETPTVDLQTVSGSADVPEHYGLLIGGSKMKTAQAKQESFVVLIVPTVRK